AASLRAGVERVAHSYYRSVQKRLILQLPAQLRPANIVDGPGQMAVLHHSFHVQVLDKDLRVVFADLGRALVKEISAHIGNSQVTTRQTQSGFLEIVRPSPLAGMGAGEA